MHLTLPELIDIPGLQLLMDRFHAATGIPVGILGSDGEIFVATGWQDICTTFHRAHPVTAERCRQSDDYIKASLDPENHIQYKCLNGLWDMAKPIIVAGEHLATIYLGQFRYDDEEIDEEFFRAQAREFDFDQERYIAALRRIPVFNRDKVQRIMDFYTSLVDCYVKTGFARFRQLETERTLRESEERYRALFEGASDAIITIRDGRIVNCNRKALELFRCAPEQLIGKGPENLSPSVQPDGQDSAAKAREMIENALAGPTQFFEWRHCRGDETSFDAEVSLNRFEYQGKTELLAIIRDVTEQKRAKEVLRLVEERFRSIFRNLPVGMVLASPDGSFIEANPALCRFLGYTMDELMKLTVEEITHPDDWEETRRLRAEAAAGQTPTFSLEKRYLRKDGVTVWGQASTTWFYDGDSAPVYSVALIQDINERKRLEEALRESENKFAKAFHATPTMLVITSMADGRFIEVNEAFARICGYGRDEVIGRTSLELGLWTDPEDRTGVVEALMRGGKARDLEINFRDKRGLAFVGLYSAEMIDINGEECLLSLVNDITARKRAEEARQRSEMRYRAIVEGFDGLIYICSHDYRVEFMNDRMIKRAGHDATGDLCYKTLHDLDAVCSWCVNERVMGGETVRWEVQSPKDNRWYYVVNTPIFNPDGTVSKQAMILDITERKEADDALKKSEAEKSLILDSTLDLVIYHDIDMKILWGNSRVLDSVGMKPEEMAGRYCWELWHQRTEPCVGCPVVLTIRTGEPCGAEIRTPDGRIWDIRGFPVKDDAGRVKGVVEFCLEITGRKRMEEEIEILNTDLAARACELESANRELEAFGYTVSHDLRSPLTGIQGYCQVLLELCSDRLGDQGTGFVREVSKSADKMDELITTMLDFSKLSRRPMSREMVDLTAVARTLSAQLRVREPERKVTFIIAEDAITEGDPALLPVVLENLIGNAWKYTSRKDDAVIEFGAVDTAVSRAFYVRDNGAGFDMAHADKLFSPFQRLPGATGFSGHGIGLATVQRIIQRHGGRVWGEGEPGSGATFYFTI